MYSNHGCRSKTCIFSYIGSRQSKNSSFGFVNVIKTLSQVVGPSIVGVITQHGAQWITFVIAGSLKATYDIGILITFLTYNRHRVH